MLQNRAKRYATFWKKQCNKTNKCVQYLKERMQQKLEENMIVTNAQRPWNILHVLSQQYAYSLVTN
jgi:hypothetical protein